MALQPDASLVSVGAFALPVFAAIKAGSYMKSVPSASALNNVRLPEFPVWHQKLLSGNSADFFRSSNSAQLQPAVDYRGATPAHVAVAVSSSPAVINAAIDGMLLLLRCVCARSKYVGNTCAVMPVDPMSATDLTGRNLLHCCSSAEAVSQVNSRIVFRSWSSNSCPLCHQVLSRCKDRTSAINAPDAFGCPPLLSMSNSAVIRAFVSRAGTAGMNSSDRSAMTALHHAALR